MLKNKTLEQDLGFIDPVDFQSIDFELSIQNVTARTHFPKERVIKAIEFHEDGLVLDVPAKTCAKGHQLAISITVTGARYKIPPLLATGHVVELVALSKDSCSAKIKLDQFERSIWEDLLELYKNRQNEIDDFLSSAKGY